MTIKLIANRYKILEELGQGGMAIVYKAYDARLEREVAVKVIRQDVFPPDELEHILKRFEREAKSLGRLSHPNIVTILDYGNQDGVPYLVMEYVPGKSLRERIAARENQRMDWHEAAQLLIPIAEALEYAHQRHVIHRDIKPGNILVTETGQVMLVDFGIAKILASEENSRLTSTGAIVGTPDYMAPEQVSNVGVDHRSDIYSLGVVFYELVTGRKPFQGPTPISTLMKHVSEPLPRPTLFVPELSDGVERIISKALAKRREDRYQSMAAFTAALASGQENEITQEFIPVSDMSDEETRDIFFEPSKPRIGSQLKPRMRLWITIALGGLIVLGCVSAMTIFRTPLLAAIFPPTPTATATFTPTPTQTQTSTVTLTPSMTFTPTPLPSQTPTASFTPLPSATPTSSRPMLYIERNTNCRLGPSTSFAVAADFVRGVTLPIIGTNNLGWWLVEIDLPMVTKLKSCWIFGNTPMGNWHSVPIIIPTP